MAFENRGAVWLQSSREVQTPLFGQALPGCGEVVVALALPPRSGADR
jgi:hypothetical protein